MYMFTPQEIRMIHEERINQLLNERSHEQKQKTTGKPRKWSLKNLFKRDEA